MVPPRFLWPQCPLGSCGAWGQSPGPSHAGDTLPLLEGHGEQDVRDVVGDNWVLCVCLPGVSCLHLLTPSSTGSISSCGPQLLGLTPNHSSVSQALRIPWLPVPCRALSQPAAPRAPGRTARGGSPSLGGSQTLAPRPPISISALLQRQRVGKCALH